MREFSVSLNGKSYSITLIEKKPTSVSYLYEGVRYDVEVTSSVATSIKADSPTLPSPPQTMQRGSPPNAAVAPMPGIVVKVLVEKDQEVTQGSPLAVIEAMKMENNIPAPRSGKVKTVEVKAGQEVMTGQLLVTFE